jgi:hypothetical protein
MLCPKWALDITRFDTVRQVGVPFQYQLTNLLPLAPTSERSGNIWSAYNPANREYTVAVQNYPQIGMDTFFTVTISDDVTSAKSVLSNIIVGHPDGSAGNPGSLTLVKIMYCPEGRHLALFSDGSLHRLDLSTKTYQPITNVKSADLPLSAAVTNAALLDGTTLKVVLYDATASSSYLARADIESKEVFPALKIQPIKGALGAESPIAAHKTIDPNDGSSKFTVIYAGNFDQILDVDETTGVQTAVVSDLTNDANGGVPIRFECNPDTKDCDTVWATSCYDPKTYSLYYQIHVADDTDAIYMYNTMYYLNKASKKYYPVTNPSVTMTFGFSSYQWVTINN